MEKEIYDEIALLEKDHWWYVSRRKIVDKVLSELNLNQGCDILEIGCGTGGNLGLLARYGRVHAIEMDTKGMELANTHNITNVEYGKLPEDMPFGHKLFDCIIMLDVLEHIEADALSVKTVYERLKSGGVFILTVPAFNFLWSFHDIIAQHKRRYTQKGLCGLLKKNCFDVTFSTYYNFFLFPVIFIVRLWNRITGKTGHSDNIMPPGIVNTMLIKIFSSERFFFPLVSLPVGVSILAVAKKRDATRKSECKVRVTKKLEQRFP